MTRNRSKECFRSKRTTSKQIEWFLLRKGFQKLLKFGTCAIIATCEPSFLDNKNKSRKTVPLKCLTDKFWFRAKERNKN